MCDLDNKIADIT